MADDDRYDERDESKPIYYTQPKLPHADDS